MKEDFNFDKYVHECYLQTSAISDPKPYSTVFVRTPEIYEKNFYLLRNKPLAVFFPKQSWHVEVDKMHKLIFVDDPEYFFTLYHNELLLRGYIGICSNVIGNDCFIDPSAVIGSEGAHICYPKDNNLKKIQLIHMGNVELKDNVTVLGGAVIERGVFGSTTIGSNTVIDCQCLIGHNSLINSGCIIAAGAVIGGSCILAENVSVGLNATIRNGTYICSNVIVGMGAVVIHDISVPGVYAGNPAKKIAEYEGKALK